MGAEQILIDKREPFSMNYGNNILDIANNIVNGERKEAYGSCTESFGTIAALWSATIKHTVTPEQVGLMMIQLKIARQVNSYHQDNLVDIAGYAQCLENLNNGN